MSMTKVAIQLDEDLLKRIDHRNRLLDEVAKLDPEEEQALAEEGLASDAAEWPCY